MKKVAETCASLKTYQFEAQVVNETVSEATSPAPATLEISAAKLPDRRRLESKGGQMASMRIFDGQRVGVPARPESVREPGSEFGFLRVL